MKVRKFLATLLSVAMILTSIQVPAFAAPESTEGSYAIGFELDAEVAKEVESIAYIKPVEAASTATTTAKAGDEVVVAFRLKGNPYSDIRDAYLFERTVVVAQSTGGDYYNIPAESPTINEKLTDEGYYYYAAFEMPHSSVTIKPQLTRIPEDQFYIAVDTTTNKGKIKVIDPQTGELKDNLTVNEGTKVAVQFVPNEGYKLTGALFQKKSDSGYETIPSEGESEDLVQYITLNQNTWVTANFDAITDEEKNYKQLQTVTIATESNGKIYLKEGKDQYKYGQEVSFKASPSNGYSSIDEDGTPIAVVTGYDGSKIPLIKVAEDDTYRFFMPPKGVTIVADFYEIPADKHTITFSDMPSGASVSSDTEGVVQEEPNKKFRANSGDTVSFKITPPAGYDIKKITIYHSDSTDIIKELNTGDTEFSIDVVTMISILL